MREAATPLPADVAGTLALFRAKPDTWEADRSSWIKDIAPLPAEPGRLRVRFEPDPALWGSL